MFTTIRQVAEIVEAARDAALPGREMATISDAMGAFARRLRDNRDSGPNPRPPPPDGQYYDRVAA
jgi:hypothetical protein